MPNSDLNIYSADASAAATTTTDNRNDELALSAGDFTDKQEVGRGSFGIIYRATLDNQDVVLKEAAGEHKDEAIVFLNNEKQVFSALPKHPLIIGYIGSFDDTLVLEYASRGNLLEISILTMQGIFSTPEDGNQWVLDMACGVAYIHANNIVHKDIKAENYVVTSDSKVKLIDFGLAETFTKGKILKCSGTPTHVAPEVLLKKPAEDCPSDIYGLGVALWQVSTGSGSPWYGQIEVKDIFRFVRAGGQLADNRKIPPHILSLARRCTLFKSSDRPHANDVVNELEAHLQSAQA